MGKWCHLPRGTNGGTTRNGNPSHILISEVFQGMLDHQLSMPCLFSRKECGMDYEQIKQRARATGQKVTDLIALAPQNDPFYTGTPNDLALGQWFALLWQAFGYTKGVHIRRVHYKIVSQDPPVVLPNGVPY